MLESLVYQILVQPVLLQPFVLQKMKRAQGEILSCTSNHSDRPLCMATISLFSISQSPSHSDQEGGKTFNSRDLPLLFPRIFLCNYDYIQATKGSGRIFYTGIMYFTIYRIPSLTLL